MLRPHVRLFLSMHADKNVSIIHVQPMYPCYILSWAVLFGDIFKIRFFFLLSPIPTRIHQYLPTSGVPYYCNNTNKGISTYLQINEFKNTAIVSDRLPRV